MKYEMKWDDGARRARTGQVEKETKGQKRWQEYFL